MKFQDEENRLKYLDFVQAAAIYMIVCFSTLYEFAKENSGPLKPGVQTVEGTVKTVIGPVYEKFHDVPFELLKFVDHKVRVLYSVVCLNLASYYQILICIVGQKKQIKLLAS